MRVFSPSNWLLTSTCSSWIVFPAISSPFSSAVPDGLTFFTILLFSSLYLLITVLVFLYILLRIAFATNTICLNSSFLLISQVMRRSNLLLPSVLPSSKSSFKILLVIFPLSLTLLLQGVMIRRLTPKLRVC